MRSLLDIIQSVLNIYDNFENIDRSDVLIVLNTYICLLLVSSTNFRHIVHKTTVFFFISINTIRFQFNIFLLPDTVWLEGSLKKIHKNYLFTIFIIF